MDNPRADTAQPCARCDDLTCARDTQRELREELAALRDQSRRLIAAARLSRSWWEQRREILLRSMERVRSSSEARLVVRAHPPLWDRGAVAPEALRSNRHGAGSANGVQADGEPHSGRG